MVADVLLSTIISFFYPAQDNTCGFYPYIMVGDA